MVASNVSLKISALAPLATKDLDVKIDKLVIFALKLMNVRRYRIHAIQGSNVAMYRELFIATMSTSVQKLKMTCAIPALNA